MTNKRYQKFRVGQTVKVVSATDTTQPEKYMGKTGRVVSIHTELAAGIGESEKDPVYFVRVPKTGTDLFWTEELKAVRA